MVFSLLLAPLAHAAGFDCMGTQCPTAEQTETKVKPDKTDDGKQAKSGHHCCCAHVSMTIDDMKLDFVPSISAQVVIAQDDSITSVVLGPPLKPPSRA